MIDKNTELQIIGSLMKHPQYLSEIDKYTITPTDFSSTFTRYLFVAIDNLYRGGASHITPVDVSSYLESTPSGQLVFSQNNGIEYLQDAEFMSEPGNFLYYYNELKKFNLVRDLKRMGLDTSNIYCENLTQPKAFDINQRFKNLSVDDILKEVKKNLLDVEKFYIQNETVQTWELENEIDNVIEAFGSEEGIGLSINGEIFSSIINGAELGALTIRSLASGCGKALPNSIKIPTPNGWKKVGNIQPGDYLFDGFGHPTKVLAIFPQGEKEVFELKFKDGRTAKCSRDHLWSYCKYSQNKSSRENRKFFTSTVIELQNRKLQRGDGQYTTLFPMQKAVEYPEKNHYLPSYLFGLALGDGSFRQHPTNKSFQFSSETDELPTYFSSTMGWILKKHSEKNYTWYFSTKNKQEGSEKINIWVEDLLQEYPELIGANSHTKYIPTDYLEDSVENRRALLQGLMDTDGSVDDKGRTNFYTVSERLKDNVVELAQSLGYKTHVSIDAHKENTTTFVVSIRGTPEEKIKLFRLRRKVERITKWANNGKRKEDNSFVPLVQISDLGYKEEMTCFLVDNPEHLFLTENFIPTHNTRLAVADACKLAFPFFYSEIDGKWVKNGACEPVLFIMTEQKPEQIIKMILAYLSGVEESKFKFNTLTDDERKRIEVARHIIKTYKTLKLMRIPNPSIEQIKLSVREEVILSQRRYVFFDYIFISPGVLNEFRGHNLRNDEILSLMATALKDLAIEQNVSIFTSTQVNAKADDNSEIRNEASLAGGRATINKADNGIIGARPTKDEIDILQKDGNLMGGIIPNRVFDVFKVRSGRWTQVRIWSYFNTGTLRLTDLFVTDDRMNPILDFYDTQQRVEWELDEKEQKFLEEINK